MPSNKKIRPPKDKKHSRARRGNPAGTGGGGTKTLWDRLPSLFVALIVIGGGAALISQAFMTSTSATVVDVKVPQLSKVAEAGKALFDENCALCHGENAGGSENAQPLVHDIYNPGHHADEAFYRAVKSGVQGHHWNFGDMPPLDHVTERQVSSIIRYVRELQEANGIFYKQHMM